MHRLDRFDQSRTQPGTNPLPRHPQNSAQLHHRIASANLGRILLQLQTLEKSIFAEDFDRISQRLQFAGGPQTGGRLPVVIQGQAFASHDQQVRVPGRRLDDAAPQLVNQLSRLAVGHGCQPAGQGNPLAPQLRSRTSLLHGRSHVQIIPGP